MNVDCFLDTNVLVYAALGRFSDPAAERLSAPMLSSEDLNHGQDYGSVRVVNPFRTH